ncbi:MAG: amino acid ABC transporter permease [Ruminococcaceae bacterium]|nr:amino acid ABC transporter permease [Oscillospiraceae bacterium]
MSFLEVTLSLSKGFLITLQIFGVTLLCSIPLGLVLSFGSMSKFAPFKSLLGHSKHPFLKAVANFRPISFITKLFIWIIRGTPLMIQVILVFYGPGLIFGMKAIPRITAVLIAFIINYSCYFSEIYRGGIESIPRGQYEAGQVLGMTKTQIFFKIVLFQVVKRIVAPMGNEIITLVKDTSLARVIMVVELVQAAQNIVAQKAIIWPLFYIAVFYLLFSGLLTILLNLAEKKLGYYSG